MEGLQTLGLGRYPVDPSAIYRNLRRLEETGMVRSDWDTGIAAGPPRRVYTITATGENYLADWAADLYATDRVLHVFLDAYEANPVASGEAAYRGSKTPSPKERLDMKVVVSSEGQGLDAATSPIFGRCPTYVFVDTGTMDVESVTNPAQNAPGGAGIQAAQFVLSRGAKAILAGNVGPNAVEVLSEAEVPAYLVEQATVREAVEAFMAGKLAQMSAATLDPHYLASAGSGTLIQGRDKELATLAAEAADLRKRLAAIMTRIDEMEKED